jgi:hypothetical protein
MMSFRRFRILQDSNKPSSTALTEGLSLSEALEELETLETQEFDVVREAAGVPGIVTIVYDPKAKKLRAQADDGTHGIANVAFPNHLRTAEGAKYKVASLTWNGKNYRASGDIEPLESTEEEIIDTDVLEIGPDEDDFEDVLEDDGTIEHGTLEWDEAVEEAEELLKELIAESGNYEHDDADRYFSGTHTLCSRYLYYSDSLNNFEALEELCDKYSTRIKSPKCTFYAYEDEDTEEDPVSEIGYYLGEDA